MLILLVLSPPSQDLTLHFVVLSFDRYSRDDVIGEVMVDLAELELTNSQEKPLALLRDITPRSYKVTNNEETNAGRRKNIHGSSDMYVRTRRCSGQCS